MKKICLWALAGFFSMSLAHADPFQQAVAQLSDKNPTVRRRAAESLGEIKNLSAVAPLTKLLTDPVPAVRSAAVDSLGVMRVQEVEPKIAQMLETDADAYVRQTAAVALGFIGNRAAVASLLKGLKDSHEGTRYASVNSLAILRDNSAVTVLTELLNSPDARMRNSASYALAKIQDKSSVPALLQSLKMSRSTQPAEGKTLVDPMVASSLLRSLGEMGDKSVIPQIKKYLEDSDNSVKIAAAHSLYLLGDKSGLAVARKFLKDKNAGSRRDAVKVIGDMGNGEDLYVLKAMNSDPDPQVQEALKYSVDRLSRNFKPAAPIKKK